MAQRTLPNVGENTRFGRHVDIIEHVWVFKGNGAACPSAVFATREKAEQWINANGKSITITTMQDRNRTPNTPNNHAVNGSRR
ncbi:MAG: hypothetical protein J0M26_00670 [Planctomycetes bacterium]|nr:hypothetical protein [Planctomycetota bacterium]